MSALTVGDDAAVTRLRSLRGEEQFLHGGACRGRRAGAWRLPRSVLLALKGLLLNADSEIDSRLGTDGNQPGLELREGAADDAALLIPLFWDSLARIPKRDNP